MSVIENPAMLATVSSCITMLGAMVNSLCVLPMLRATLAEVTTVALPVLVSTTLATPELSRSWLGQNCTADVPNTALIV